MKDTLTLEENLIKALNDIIQCCDGNEPKHEEIYYIAKDAIDKGLAINKNTIK